MFRARKQHNKIGQGLVGHPQSMPNPQPNPVPSRINFLKACLFSERGEPWGWGEEITGAVHPGDSEGKGQTPHFREGAYSNFVF